MAASVTDKTMEHVAILAQLDLNESEKSESAHDMIKMLGFIDKLEELDTNSVKPKSYVLPLENVFRNDDVRNTNSREALLKNAPALKDGQIVVPRTVEAE